MGAMWSAAQPSGGAVLCMSDLTLTSSSADQYQKVPLDQGEGAGYPPAGWQQPRVSGPFDLQGNQRYLQREQPKFRRRASRAGVVPLRSQRKPIVSTKGAPQLLLANSTLQTDALPSSPASGQGNGKPRAKAEPARGEGAPTRRRGVEMAPAQVVRGRGRARGQE